MTKAIRSQLDRLESAINTEAENKPLPYSWDRYYVTVHDYPAFYALMVDYLRNGVLRWGKKQLHSDNIGFGGGPNFREFVEKSGREWAGVTNAGYALEGIIERMNLTEDLIPADTEEMIECLLAALAEKDQEAI